jgi:hypothetical protein
MIPGFRIKRKSWGLKRKSPNFGLKTMGPSAWDLFLPEGMLDYFEVTATEKTKDHYVISLVEKNLGLGEFSGQKLISKISFQAFTAYRSGIYAMLLKKPRIPLSFAFP